jgi:hypothetical protein
MLQPEAECKPDRDAAWHRGRSSIRRFETPLSPAPSSPSGRGNREKRVGVMRATAVRTPVPLKSALQPAATTG